MTLPMTALRRPATAGVLVGLLIIVAWWQLLWNPQSSALARTQSAEQTASTGLIEAGQTLGHLKHLQQISPQLVALEQRLSAAVPSGPSLDTFLISVNEMAESAGVDLQSVAPTPPPSSVTTTPTTAATATGALTSTAISLSLTGGYFNMQRFLDELNTGSRLVVIDSLAEAPAVSGGSNSGSDGGAGTVGATIRVHILSGLASPPASTGLLASGLPASPSGGH